MTDRPPTNQYAMRVLGVLMLIFSFGEIGVGTYTYRFMTNVHIGGWWGVIAVFMSGILATISNSRQTVTAGCFIGIFGVFSSMISGIIDGIAASVFNNLISCENTTTLKIYGSDDYVMQTDLAICMNDKSADLPTHQCVCTDKSFCGYYRLSDSHNCGLILTLYSQCLIASAVLLGLSFIVVLIYSVVACRSVCSDQPVKSSSPQGAMESRFSDVEQPPTNGTVNAQEEEREVEIVPASLPALLENSHDHASESDAGQATNRYALVESHTDLN